ncbi:GIY-YIG nuclease family protein [Martelella radicis]|uniref:SsDNA-binding Zn-finger/Zn-ribbon topoisomerase 1 n=1 Tax=Martelella radicis TaxID=1397476 RepID=A0A7W6PDE7_9HYPH|nr:GIY-YIG nuclease family protein [Martelella radicis]MBB4124704.1 ssDNA-binding Zn-finger/Zn-ribbon topoisomerase 1 [Martelella radicis]
MSQKNPDRLPKKPARLHVPRRSRHIPQSAWTPYPRPIPPQWKDIAESKGFRVVGRVRDRYHVVLECKKCSRHTVQKVFVLRTATPLCAACQETRGRENAENCGYRFLKRDEHDRHYAQYLLPCGHTVRRQFGRIEKLSRNGLVDGRPGYRCPECYFEKLQSEAHKRGWTLVGPDPENDPSYRFYRHSTGCGHQQRIAIANMSSARFGCERCGECWSSAPSNLYLIRFTVPNRGEYLKLGYSRNPQSRVGFQFGLSKGVKASLLKLYPMPTGHAAQKTEKRLHNRLRHRFPDAVVPASELSGWINVVSEIYRPRILTEIQQLLKTEIC